MNESHGRLTLAPRKRGSYCTADAPRARQPPSRPAAPPDSSLELPPPPTPASWLERSWLGRGYLERGCLRARGNLDVGGAHELVVAVVSGLHLLTHDALLVLVARLRLVHATPGEGDKRRQRRRRRGRAVGEATEERGRREGEGGGVARRGLPGWPCACCSRTRCRPGQGVG